MLNTKKTLFILFIIATVMRLLYIELHEGLSGPLLPFDSTEYNNMALNILDGKGFVWSQPPFLPGKPGYGSSISKIFNDNFYNYPTAFRQPGYPLFLAGMHLLFNDKAYLIAVRVLECIIGGLTCIIAYYIGKVCFNRWVGISSAIASAIYPFLIVHDTFMVETIYLFLIAVAVLFLLKASNHWNYKYFILSGLFFGLCALFKAPLLLFPFFIFVWLFFYGKKNYKKGMVGFLLLILTFVCVISPWVIRNKIVMEKLTFQNGTSLWLYATNNHTIKPAFHEIAFATGWELIYDSCKKDNIDLKSEVAVDDYCHEKVIEFIRNNPKKFLILTLSRYVCFWKIFSSNVSIWLNLGSIFTYGILFIFMLAGIVFIFIKRNIHGMLLVLLLLYYSAVHSLILTYMRYRYPVEIYIVIIAMYGFYEIVSKYQTRIEPNK